MSTESTLTAVGALAAVVAAIFAVKSWRLQKRQDEIAVSSQPLTDDELQLLRTVERFGPISRSPGGPCFWIGEKMAEVRPENAWVEEAIETLRHKNLLERHAAPISLTSEGALVLRAKVKRKLTQQRKIHWTEQPDQSQQGGQA